MRLIQSRLRRPRRLHVIIVGIVFSLGIASSMLNTAGAAVAHVATTIGDNAGGSTSVTANHPSSGAVGNVMIAVVGVRGGSGVTITPPSGWTLINTSNTSTATTMKSSTYWKAVASTDTSTFSFGFSASQKASMVISSYSGVDASDPVNTQTVATGSTASMSATQVTTTVPNTMLVAAYNTATGTTMTAGSSMTLRGQDASTGANANTRTTTGLQDALQAATGASGAKTMTAGTAALTVQHLIALRPDPVLTQAKFRFFANSDSTTASTPLAAIDTAAAIAKQTPFRLRMNIGVGTAGSNLTTTNRTFKLQYALRGSDNVCDTSFTNETYSDVSGSTDVQFYNNTTPADGATYVASANDPTRGLTNIVQYYEEIAPMAMRTNVATNQDAYWDLSLTTSASVSDGNYYCFRTVTGGDASLSGGYTIVPQIYIQPPVITQSNYRWYPNADSAAPGTPTVAQNTATTIAPSTPFRLRQRLAIDSAQLNASAGSYKLQYAEKSGTCSASFGGITKFVNQTGVTLSQTKLAGAASTSGSDLANWQSVSNITADDGVNASAVANNVGPTLTNTLIANNFGFTIPTAGTIVGIEVRGDTETPVGVGALDYETFVVSQASFTSNLASSSQWQGVMAWGGPTTLGGVSWTPAMVNHSTFGVELKAYVPFDSSVQLDMVSVTAYYTAPNDEIMFNDNATPANGATIAASNDPTGRTIVYQTYNETDPYSNTVAAIASGSDGLWDFSLTSGPSTAGKTYCFRTVKSDGSPIDTYSVYPEITFASAGPTLDQQVRGGASVVGGSKSPLVF